MESSYLKIKAGKSTQFTVSDILLDGRQIILKLPDPEALTGKIPSIECILPGAMVPFKVKKRNKTGLMGTVFGFNATLFQIQSRSPLELGTDDEIPARIIYVDPEKKRICLATAQNFVAMAAEAPLDRDGEKVTVEIVSNSNSGLLVRFGERAEMGWVPRYNITEQKLDDPITHYQTGKSFPARVIGYLMGEGLHLLTMRESVVEAEFFRYDSFSPTQIVKAKVVSVNEAGWVNVSLAPHLFGTISPNHLANSNLSKETILQKYKPGAQLKLMVLDKASDRLYLTAKAHLIKSKLTRFCDLDAISVGDISLGTIILVHDRCIVVQFFNNIRAFVPISQLSLEHIKKVSDNYEKGQTVRVRVMDIKSNQPNQITGSLILDPTLKVKREKSEDSENIFGKKVETFTFEGDVDATTAISSFAGKTEEGKDAVIHETDLAMDQNVSRAFFHQLKRRRAPLKSWFKIDLTVDWYTVYRFFRILYGTH